MATELVYLNDFDVTKCSAKIVGTQQDDQGRQIVMLDKTCFYPRGGGQDWDTGLIKNDKATFRVDEVRLDEAGVVHHIGTYIEGEFKEGDEVNGEVNQERRDVNTKLHSAGHLLDMAVQQLDLLWIPGRGAHYPHMSFVEYQAPGFEVGEDLQNQIQAKLDELAASTYKHQILFMPVEEMGKYCRHVPANIPTNKPARIVLYADDFGIPCGGTHVRKVSDIGKTEIVKMKAKKGVIKVSYRVEGIN